MAVAHHSSSSQQLTLARMQGLCAEASLLDDLGTPQLLSAQQLAQAMLAKPAA